MNTISTVTRRDALKSVVSGSIAIAPVVLMPSLVMAAAASEQSPNTQPVEATEFIPENDYPYFGWHPQATLSQP